jgi:Fe-S-cluster containining protein
MKYYKILNVNLTSFTTDEPIEDVPCGTCTRCCELLAPNLTPDEISSGKYPLSLINPTPKQLADNPDIGPIVTIFKKDGSGCHMFIDGKCSIYEYRPIACRQFDCRKGHHPSVISIANEKFGTALK